MNKLYVSIVMLAMLAMLALPLYGAATPETASPAPAGNGNTETGELRKPADISIRSLSGIIAVRIQEEEPYPALIDAGGNLVRLEGDIARQLAYGSEGLPVSIKGYSFTSASTPPRFVVTWLERSARKEEQDERQ